ncbi:hypothetical protein [Pseudomonas syringae]|uniref:hypothetical protein n=1 Tax=Pseudomonas syringae TaxID=317 RepID=UPI00070D8F6B|nr:hypothetical protein [Pseudomonas syringae]KWS32312.1 hypothetical protein AL060_05685 [Pseudomonas syringae pv. rhaphiolepidis]
MIKKTIFLLGFGVASQGYAACQDRYYYYKPTLTVTKEQKWQVYDDKGFINSRELADIQEMVKGCGFPVKGAKYNFQAIVNMIVPADFYQLKNPLFSYPNIRLPNGVNGGQGVYLDIRQRPGFSNAQAQHSGEIKKARNIGIVQVYLVRDGKDDLKTPEWIYKSHSYLQGNGYSYTVFK